VIASNSFSETLEESPSSAGQGAGQHPVGATLRKVPQKWGPPVF